MRLKEVAVPVVNLNARSGFLQPAKSLTTDVALPSHERKLLQTGGVAVQPVLTGAAFQFQPPRTYAGYNVITGYLHAGSRVGPSHAAAAAASISPPSAAPTLPPFPPAGTNVV